MESVEFLSETPEEALRESEVGHRALVENSPDAIALYDRDLRCLYANPAAVSGWRKGTSRGAEARELGPVLPGLLKEVMENASGRIADLEIETPGGSRRFQVRLVPECSRDGRVESVLVVGRDITELLQAKEEAEQRARELDVVLESLADGLIIYDPDHRIVRINQAAQQIIGLPMNDLLQEARHRIPMIRLTSADGRKLKVDERPGRRALRGETIRSLEINVQTKGRPPVPILNSTAPIRDPRGKVIGAVQTLSDITRYKTMERELQKARLAAEEASRAKSEFLAHMSHEIRTPISAIIGLAEVLLPRLGDPEQQQFLRLIGDSARSLLTIIGSVLDLSRIEAGKVEVRPRSFSPRQVLKMAVDTAALRAREKGLTFLARADRQVPSAVRGDPDLVLQVLRNLLSNAVKYTQRGVVRVHLAIRDRADGRGELFISVSDTGIGIPADRQHRLFESFCRLHADIQRGGPEGTGLGLAISRRLVELMGGEITVESVEGEGSTFRFSVPVTFVDGAKGVESPVRKRRRPINGLAGLLRLRVLLAEDHPANRLVLRTAFQDAGHLVTEVADGRQAVQAVRRDPPDLVLMDIQLPLMDGVEATREIRRLPEPASRIPIVAVTAFALKGDEERFLQSGMNGYVSKPVDLKLLTRTIRRVLRTRNAIEMSRTI